jgi:3-oxoacyl-[acyl-carrier-protein] synthase-3
VWPDYAEIQAKIGAKNANSLKILQQCNGQIASLDYVRSKMLSDNDINLALVVAAEKYSKPLINRWNSNLLFWGDGASAAVIKRSQKVNNTILFSKLITDGTYNRIWQASLKGGTVLPFSHKTKLAKNEMLADFFRFGAKYQYDDSERKKITDLMCSKNNQIISTLLKANIKINKIVTVNREISWIYDIANKFNVDINNTSAYLVKDYAHMGACDIIFNFHKMLLDNKIKKKDKVLLLSVGAGYSAGIILLEFL